jgi:hypothetical protein
MTSPSHPSTLSSFIHVNHNYNYTSLISAPENSALFLTSARVSQNHERFFISVGSINRFPFIMAKKIVLCGTEYECLVLGINFRLQIVKKIREVSSLARLCLVCEIHDKTYKLLNSSMRDNAILVEEARKEKRLEFVPLIEPHRFVSLAQGA